MQRLVDHASANLRPLICVLGTENYEVDRDAEIAESLAESYELRSTALQLRLNDKQIQVAVGTTLATGARAEEDHLGTRRSSRKTTASLRNESLVSHSHSVVVVSGG
jgi:hypothetical protein